MQKPKAPNNEIERQKVLDSYQILDSSPEGPFDDLTLIASQICQTPIALISLVDKERQWFKSKYGLEADETHRDISFCGHAINEPNKIFEISDAKIDERFADNPLVTGDLNVEFYAGVPLLDSDELALGTLCVIDHKPRNLSEDQKKAMKALAREAMYRLRMHKANQVLKQEVDDNKEELRQLNNYIEREMVNLKGDLHFHKERLELAFSGSNEGVLDWINVAHNKQWWSAKFHELIGYEEGEIEQSITSFLTTLLHPDDFKKTSLRIQACIDNGKAFDLELRLKSKTGEYRWYRGKGNRSFNGDHIRMTGSITDINKEKLLEIKLLETERFLTKVTDIAPSIIYVFNQETMSNEYANKEIGKVLGYSTEEIDQLGEELISTLCHPDDLNSVFAHFGNIQQLEENEVISIEYRMRHKDGMYRWLLSDDTVFERNGEGKVRKHLGVATDVSKLKKIQERLETKTELQKVQNEELKQFSYVATHDLKGPMISISGHFDYLKRHINSSNEDVVESIGFVEQGIDQFNRTLKGLNDAIRLREVSVKKEVIDLADILKSTISVFRSQVEQLGGRLEVDLHKVKKFRGVELYVISTLQNLLSNSIKYRSNERDLIVCISSNVTDKYLCLLVEDNGLGINLDRNKDKIFKMFSRFHTNVEGNGMGLYMVKNMVEKMGGKIKIESEENKGTKFTIRLKR